MIFRTIALLPLAVAGIAMAQTTTLEFQGLNTAAVNGGYGDYVDGPNAGNAGLAQLVVTLSADQGHITTLESFDLGNWGAAVTLPYVRIVDENGATLFEDLSVDLNANTSPDEKNYVLSPVPVGRTLTLQVSVSGLLGNADNVGIDNLCVAGSIGRYVGAGQIQNSGASGTIALDIDLARMPTPTGPIPAQSGETWFFQAWHRDVQAGVMTSNFTEALSIDFVQ